MERRGKAEQHFSKKFSKSQQDLRRTRYRSKEASASRQTHRSNVMTDVIEDCYQISTGPPYLNLFATHLEDCVLKNRRIL